MVISGYIHTVFFFFFFICLSVCLGKKSLLLGWPGGVVLMFVRSTSVAQGSLFQIDLAEILMPFWRSFMAWGGRELASSMGLLWFRPYRRSSKLTFQRSQAGDLSELSGLCGVYSEPESGCLFCGHHATQLQAIELLWVCRPRVAKNCNFLRVQIFRVLCNISWF